jgi:Flp pilus assembly protein TadG
MIGRLAHIRRAEEGATAVELVVVMSAALVLIFGMIEFALAYWTMHSLQLATDEGGRYAMVYNKQITLATAESYMTNFLPGASSSCSNPASPSAGQYCVNAFKSTDLKKMTLTATYGFNLIGIGGTFTLAGVTTVPLD